MYIINSGTTRIVVVFPEIGIVLKIARIKGSNIVTALQWTVLWLQDDKNVREVFPTFRKLLKNFKSIAFRGLMANIYEVKIWKETKSSFLWPTYFSLLGLINIQPLAKRLAQEGDFDYNSWWVFIQIATEFYSWECCHSWEERNFCFDSSGKLKMLDYGSQALVELFRKYGDKLLSIDCNALMSKEEIDKFYRSDWAVTKHKIWYDHRLKYE